MTMTQPLRRQQSTCNTMLTWHTHLPSGQLLWRPTGPPLPALLLLLLQPVMQRQPQLGALMMDHSKNLSLSSSSSSSQH